MSVVVWSKSQHTGLLGVAGLVRRQRSPQSRLAPESREVGEEVWCRQLIAGVGLGLAFLSRVSSNKFGSTCHGTYLPLNNLMRSGRPRQNIWPEASQRALGQFEPRPPGS